MIDKLLNSLKANIRDIVLAGVAAGLGVIIAAEVVPKTSQELKVLLTAALYAALRAAVAYIVALISK